LTQVSFTSEASRLSRLYWWTAEYGLVGTPRDYRLYGAGLLSSLWESHSCHDRAVHKLPLSAACIEQAYDITRPQPQLFVARDFDHLFDVLSEVDASLVHHAGGDRALSAALASGSVATLHFGAGRFATGQLSAVSGGARGGLLTFRGQVGLGAGGQQQALFGAPASGYHLPFGRFEDSTLGATGQRVALRFATGAQVEGVLAATTVDAAGRPLLVRLLDYHLTAEQAGLSERGAEYSLLLAPELVTAHAGATDAAFFPASEPSSKRVPAPRDLQQRERALLSLYERAIAAFREHLGSAAVPAFSSIHAELTRSFPDEWLLRWNLLECLCKLGEQGAFARTLEGELVALELKFSHQEPIASGLRYLASLAA
jgi:phenylalanine-4-hydroxylase